MFHRGHLIHVVFVGLFVLLLSPSQGELFAQNQSQAAVYRDKPGYSPLLTGNNSVIPGAAASPANLEELVIGTDNALPDLDISLQLRPPVASPGDSVELSITIYNQGAIAVEGYIFELSLEDGLTLAGAVVDEMGKSAGLADNQLNLPNLGIGATQRFTTQLLVDADAGHEQIIQIQNISPPGNRLETAVATLWLRPSEQTENVQNNSAVPEGLEPSLWVFRPNAPAPSLFSGAATYNYPFETPPARGGVGPSLSLNYSSRSVDGKVGWFDSNPYGEGWSLDGTPFITRQDPHYCPLNGEFDICFSPWYPGNPFQGMKLYLNGSGHNLTPDGSCGINCYLYVAENAPGLRVEHYTTYNPGNPPDLASSWLVRTPDGNRYHFGAWEDSRQVFVRACFSPLPPGCEGSAVYRWYLDQVEDPHNNRMVMIYEDQEATGNWGCNYLDICREVDVWPKFIRYNNSVANPNRYNRNDWKAEVDLEWSSLGVSVDGGWPIMAVTHRLNNIRVHARNEAGVWQEAWRYAINQSEISCPGGSGSYCPNNARRRVLSSVQRVENGGQTWPPTSFVYDETHIVGRQENYCIQWIDWDKDGIPDFCAQTATVFFSYPHLVRVDNGYGGVYEFAYESLGPQDNGAFSWRVTDFKAWDGLKDVYGQGNPTTHQVIAYEGPCYHQYNACYEGLGDEGYVLVGHDKAHAISYEYDGGAPVFLSRQDSHYLVGSSEGGHPLLYGKAYAQTQYADEAGTIPVSQTFSDWYLNDAVWEYEPGQFVVMCPRQQFTDNWACLAVVRRRYYALRGDSAVQSHSDRTWYRYEANWQGQDWQPPRQWGIATRIEYFDAESGTDLVRREGRFYVYNDTPSQWVIRQWADVVWRDWFDPKQNTVFLYGANTDPDQQTINRSDQLKWSRAVAEPAGQPQGEPHVYDTVDSSYEYGNWGLVTAVKSYNAYGQQDVVVGEEWLPMRPADLSPFRTGAVTFTAYRDSGVLVHWVQNTLGHRITLAYGGHGSHYPWQVTRITDANNLATDYLYDTLGRLQYVIGPEATGASPSLEYEYLVFSGGPVRISEIIRPQENEDIRHQTLTVYDGFGRAVESRVVGAQVHGIPQRVHLVTAYDYDGLGRAICQSVPFSWPAGQPIPHSACYTNPHTTTRYDPAGRVSQLISPDGTATSSVYGALSAYVYNAGNQLQAAFKDELGRLSAIDEYADSFQDTFETGDSLGNWQEFGARGSYGVTDGSLYIIKDGGAQYGVTRALSTTDAVDGAVTFAFKADAAGVHWFSLESGAWDQASYRLWGVQARADNVLYLQEWKGNSNGSNERLTALMDFEPETWYQALLRTSQDADRDFTIVVWKRDDPGVQAEVRIRKTGQGGNGYDDDWFRTDWRFTAKTSMDENHVYLDNYVEAYVSRTRYAYDTQNNLTDVWDAANNHTGIAYDGLGRKSNMTDPDMGYWQYQYNPAGNLVRQIDNAGQTLCFEYDLLNRLKRKGVGNTGATLCTISETLASYSYDPLNGKGQLHTVSWGPDPANNRDELFYDSLGRLYRQDRRLDGRLFTMMTTEFDLLNRPTRVQYPDGEIVTTTYDHEGENSLKLGANTFLVDNITYNARGQMVTLARPGALPDTTFSYFGAIGPAGTGNSNFRLSGIQHGGVDALPDFTYEYDLVGNISQLNSASTAVNDRQKFSYDHLNRLVAACTVISPVNLNCANSADSDYNHAYRYDALGNILSRSENGTAITYGYQDAAHVHAVTHLDNEEKFWYDDNGNMITRVEAGSSYSQTFDIENRLVQVQSAGAVTEFRYDAGGQRTRTVRPDGVVIYYPFAGYEEEHGGLFTANKLLAGDGAAGDQLGMSVAIDGDTAVAGAYRDDNSGGVDAGAAYVYVRQANGSWSQQAKLTASDGAAEDSFGFSVAINGNTTVVGAYGDDNSGGVDAGAAYVFVRQANGSWSQQAKLSAADGAAGDRFGDGVAIDGNTAVIGAYLDDNSGGVDAGAVYIFARQANGSWLQQAKLTASDGAAGDRFGHNVALSGNTAVIGAHLDDNGGGIDAGAAYVFVRQANGSWSQQAKLTASDGAAVDYFGHGVAISGNMAVIGAYLDDNGGGVDAGAAYVFARQANGSWLQQAKLTASDGAADDRFGHGVAISGNTAVIGAHRDDDNGVDAGAAYVFVRQANGSWSQQAKVSAADGAAADYFGRVVALSGQTAVAGAYLDDNSNGTDAGSAYIFHAGAPVQRSTYSIAGQAIAVKVAGDPNPAVNGLFYIHSDHLGSTSILSYGYNLNGSPHPQAGQPVPGSQARYLPFGGWRTQPTAGLTDRGYTGHKHDNLGSSDIGLIYMNARFYVPNTNRFLTPDTIVPDPTNPQSFNRYSYAYNNPLRYRDADGHRPCELVCPGDWILAGSFTGAGYNGPWDIAQQRQNAQKAEALLVEVRNIGVGILWEPADWAIALSDGFQWYDGLGMLPLVPAAFGNNIGRAAARLIPAGWADEAGAAIGHWVSRNLGNADWARYQARVTGVDGAEFMFNGVRFDGAIGTMNASGEITDLVLLDAKHWSEGFIRGMVYGNNPGAYHSKIQQARQQIAAANGVRIQWHFSDEAAANLWRDALAQEEIYGIDVIYTP